MTGPVLSECSRRCWTPGIGDNHQLSVLMVPFRLPVFLFSVCFSPAIYQPTRATICTFLTNLYNTYFRTTWHFPQNLQVSFVPLNNNDHCHKHPYLSPSTARSLYDVMNGGCQGGKGRGLGRKKRWNKASYCTVIFLSAFCKND